MAKYRYFLKAQNDNLSHLYPPSLYPQLNWSWFAFVLPLADRSSYHSIQADNANMAIQGNVALKVPKWKWDIQEYLVCLFVCLLPYNIGHFFATLVSQHSMPLLVGPWQYRPIGAKGNQCQPMAAGRVSRSPALAGINRNPPSQQMAPLWCVFGECAVDWMKKWEKDCATFKTYQFFTQS